MLAALAHDLRTPLTALRVRAEMVDDCETRDGISTSLDEMQDMVEATLAYARGVGQGEDQQRLNIAEYLSAIHSDTQGDLEVQVGPEAIVQIKPVAMRRALRNLIDNAQRYGRNPVLSWKAADLGVEITVDDAGPGIPEERIGDVFQPFQRIEKSRSLETGGHGLGLAIARSIVLIGHAVSDSTNGFDHGTGRTELLADRRHMHVDRPFGHSDPRADGSGDQRLTCQNTSRGGHQCCQQPELGQSQPDRFPVGGGFVAFGIDTDRPEREHRADLFA